MGAASVSALLVGVSWSFWKPATYLAFILVEAILSLFGSSVVADPRTATLGISGFNVVIGAPCSGLGGVALMLVLSVGWLLVFRRECCFPQALVLVPAGLLTVWLANALRIAGLILIGAAGAQKVAIGGFHSKAGWIAFNAVAVVFCLCAQRLPWVRAPGGERSCQDAKIENPTATYLMPFLTILTAGMISQATAGGFEWLYPLRFFAGAAMLWHFRSRYRGLDWNFGWLAPMGGSLMFVL